MPKMVNLKIDDKSISAAEGTMIVRAARENGIDIPVFCYHPKLPVVGMCRMCLVEIGRPVIDRNTSQPLLEADGSPKIGFGPKLETACTTSVAEGMHVVTASAKVASARRDVIEFLLTSHPLDCPVCDKGGECPLQNLTLKYGPSQSRFELEEKQHLAKMFPLGELIMLDRERCIQCGRCVRFQSEIADDPVISFYERGQKFQIITDSTPGFNSVFSGNTTDICPVGALTTADFRFGARPWEMCPTASICTACPVGCNTMLNTRAEIGSDGKFVIKRIMPRQNESVNEIWLCDKGRYGFHYVEGADRLTQPLIRRDGKLTPATWEEAFKEIGTKLKSASSFTTLVGGVLSNEDLFNLKKLSDGKKGNAVLYETMSGGEQAAEVGVGVGTNLGMLGKGSAILVVASDLHEEAPVWWLRVTQAVKRGTELIVVNARKTRLDKYASHVIRYEYGQEAETIGNLEKSALKAFTEAENAIIFAGSEGLTFTGSEALMKACANLLISTSHYGKANNGLIPVWPKGNTQGAWDIGFRPAGDLAAILSKSNFVYIAGANPIGDSPELADLCTTDKFLVVQDLFLTESAKAANVVLPVLPFTERLGSVTNAERRVQLFYQAIEPLATLHPDFWVTAGIAHKAGIKLEGEKTSEIFKQISAAIPAYSELNYEKLAEVTHQYPTVGRDAMYYGGTVYDNRSGLGAQTPSLSESGKKIKAVKVPAVKFPKVGKGYLVAIPIEKLYDQGTMLKKSDLLHHRLAQKACTIHPKTAKSLKIDNKESVSIQLDGRHLNFALTLDENIPENVILIPRSTGVPILEPVAVKVN